MGSAKGRPKHADGAGVHLRSTPGGQSETMSNPIPIAWAALAFAAAACGGEPAGPSGPAPAAGSRPSAPVPTVAVADVPAGPLRQPVRFRFRVDYRDVPVGAGLLVSIHESRGPAGAGGGLTLMPVPIAGSGSVELVFDGSAITAPADAPLAHSVPPGDYRLRARVGDSRKTPWSMIDNNGRELASAESAAFTIVPGGPVRSGYWRPEE